MRWTLIVALGLLLAGTSYQLSADSTGTVGKGEASVDLSTLSVATFAGGCFWCTEADFEKVPGVYEAISGYAGGEMENPTYKQVASGRTKHTEAVQVYYDSEQISYEGLLQAFWRMHDPTDADGQFVDRGKQYRPAIFYHNETHKAAATASRDALAASGRFDKPLALEIVALDAFYTAEEYHQDYYKKSPLRYKTYRYGSGRDQFLDKVWGKDLKLNYSKYNPSAGNDDSARSGEGDEARSARYAKPADAVLRKRLTTMQYNVTQKDGTEPPFDNAYWDNKREGIYVDIVTGEPLFSSRDKYKSGTGWPSFTRPLEAANVVEKTDYKLIYPRTEIRSKHGDSHLGHVFSDGPEPTGLRYCMNSAALRFVPKDKLAAEGYAEYVSHFADSDEADNTASLTQ